jgi:hypothetical protein
LTARQNNTRATPPNPARVSGRRNPNCVSRVYSSSAQRLVAVMRVALWGKCVAGPIPDLALSGCRRFGLKYLCQISVEPLDQALDNAAELLPVVSPLCAVRHAQTVAWSGGTWRADGTEATLPIAEILR